ncbi:MAG: peptidoglycan DD-metalloendopeptidase family protein [Erythrobacter sp.]
MATRHVLFSAICAASLAAIAFAVPQSVAQRDAVVADANEARAELRRATRESKRAQARAARFRRGAEAASASADKTAREAAALAAQIQSSEADITAARARYSIAKSERAGLSVRLAERRQPIVRLTSALQTTSRRPLALSALQPGSLKDLVYVRAVLDSAVPEIRKRTASLRSDLDKGRELENDARRALTSLRNGEQQLEERRSALAALEVQQRRASRQARATAVREGERALALAEEARDLDGLVDQLGANASLRKELAALSGPVLRPSGLSKPSVNVGASPAPEATPTAAATASASSSPPSDLQLPVQGRIITGFGEKSDSGLRSKGLSLAPSAGAQVVAPGSGRVAFSGPYRGFGRIVIIEHDDGWTSLVTGLRNADVEVGDTVIGGSPLGRAAQEEPLVTLELRRDSKPVNPLQMLR